VVSFAVDGGRGRLFAMSGISDDSAFKNAQLAAIVDSSDDAIVSKDLNGIVTSWNAAAERIFGYSAAEMIGQPIVKLFPSDRALEEDDILARIRAGERVDHFETIRVTKDGRKIHVSLTISPIRDANGQIVGASKIARDISVRAELEAERERLLERERALRLEAERANRIKNEFLATLSHELRTPLTAIHGWAQILQTGTADKETMIRAAEVISRNTHLQTQLIDELLDMNRILMGKVRLDVQMVDLGAIIDSVVDSIGPAASAKQIEIRRLLDPRAGGVRGDPVRLQQILWNLLSNAVKFTPAKGHVDVTLERINSHVEISVSDTGIGIPADFLPLVFDRFSQVDSSTTRRHGGLGIGLAIVKHLVELHGGSVWVESTGPDCGSTFRVTLPFPVGLLRGTAEIHPRAPSAGEAWNAPDLAGCVTLVVDDDKDTAGLISHILGDSGATVVQANSGDEALEQIALQTFDALISDIGMPEMDGFQLMRKIRAGDPGLRKIPAIALTAFGRSEDRRNAMIAGFDVFLSKPIDAAELLATVARVTSRNR
jgi:PAS domain S-box-containing protein